MGKKDHIRDYATAAFRFYKASGGAEAYKNKVWNDALMKSQKSDYKNNGISKPTEAAIMRAQTAVDKAVADIAELEAVERTLDIISGKQNGRAMLEAVNIVYFTDADKALKKGDIHNRVTNASSNIPVSESSVYKYLKKARFCFAVERGLRI